MTVGGLCLCSIDAADGNPRSPECNAIIIRTLMKPNAPMEI